MGGAGARAACFAAAPARAARARTPLGPAARRGAAGAARAPARAARVRAPACSARGGGEGEDDGAGAGRGARDADLLPFDVRVIAPPGTVYLGRFRLDARTHCGDLFEHGGRQFVVKRVTMHYRYAPDGRPRVFRKTIDIKSLARKALEAYLEKALQG